MYLSNFQFADELKEELFLNDIKRTCYNSFYPFGVLSMHHLHRLDFEPVTILYGGNGSGKSTALNVICEKLGLHRDTLYNRSSFYEDYLQMCEYETEHQIPEQSCMITSDDGNAASGKYTTLAGTSSTPRIASGTSCRQVRRSWGP